MKVFNFENKKPDIIQQDTVFVLGYFDGYHLGHRKLVEHAKKLAIANKWKVGIITFDRSPYCFINNIESTFITPLSRRIDLFAWDEIDYCTIVKFDLKLMNTPGEEFINELIEKYNVKHLVVGKDFRCGMQNKLTANDLSKIIPTDIVDFLTVEQNRKLSSSLVRELLTDGFVNIANSYTKEPFVIEGKVIYGTQQGRVLGFPTANVEPKYKYHPISAGIYLGYSIVDDLKYPSLIINSTKPTLENLKDNALESYILDFDQDIYNHDITLEFLVLMRLPKKYNSINELRDAIEQDVIKARQWFLNNRL